MPRFSLNAIGRDRPGIIAGVAQALVDLGANLEDSRMTILHGQFTIMLVLDVPHISDGGLIEGALEQVAEELNLFITVRPVPDEVVPPTTGERYLVAVDGPDRPGLIAGVSRALASVAANVVELSSRHFEQGAGRVCVLRMTVVLPDEVDTDRLESVLSDACTALGVSHSVTPAGDAVV